MASLGHAQQSWQPSRLPASPTARALPSQSGPGATPATRSISSSSEKEVHLGTNEAVVLRWKKPVRQTSPAPSSPHASAQQLENGHPARAAFAVNQQGLQPGNQPTEPLTTQPNHRVAGYRDVAPWQNSRPPVAGNPNPLRETQGGGQTAGRRGQAQFANYQEVADPFENPFPDQATNAPPPHRTGPPPKQPSTPQNYNSIQNDLYTQQQDGGGFPALPPTDPLQVPEQAPAPGGISQDSILQDLPPSPFSRSNDFQNDAPQFSDPSLSDPSLSDPSLSGPSASDQRSLPDMPQDNQSLLPDTRPDFPPALREDESDNNSQLEMPNRLDRYRALSCEDRRNLLKSNPISKVSLDVSPAFGEGMRGVRQQNEDKRLEFAAQSEVRRWYGNNGELLATGRMIDLQHDNVVLDINGSERTLSLRDLSDVDSAYVGEAWGIPLSCGRGSFDFVGRSYVPSAAQWKASGLCHKPLYFEQPQLERYGHEIGPILQPIVSTAHFFGSIAVLPYKMGIHPPNECQHPLGYYRPGSCAPYMLRPIPWSLRGAAVQAGVVGGAVALIP